MKYTCFLIIVLFAVAAGKAAAQSCPGNSGCPDLTFGVAGVYFNDISPATSFEFINDLGTQPDGKFVGSLRIFDYPVPGGQVFNVARFNPDGSLDVSFAGDGVAEVPFTQAVDNEYANSIAIQSDGKVVAAGCVIQSNGYRSFGITRLNSDGTPDSNFGSEGKVLVSFASRSHSCAASVAIQPDGAIVAAGYDGDNRFAWARLTTSGALDTTFNGTGKLTLSLRKSTDTGGVTKIKILDNSKILTLGIAPAVRGTERDAALVMLNGNGTLDSSFGNGGKVFIDFYSGRDHIYCMAIDSIGRILIGGWAMVNPTDFYSQRIALARILRNGVIDTTFGSLGKVSAGPVGVTSEVRGIAIQTDGKLFIGGVLGVNTDTFVGRFNPNGTPDSGFGLGGNGLVITDLMYEMDVTRGVLVLPDGKLLAYGGAYNGPTALIKYVP